VSHLSIGYCFLEGGKIGSVPCELFLVPWWWAINPLIP